MAVSPFHRLSIVLCSTVVNVSVELFTRFIKIFEIKSL